MSVARFAFQACAFTRLSLVFWVQRELRRDVSP